MDRENPFKYIFPPPRLRPAVDRAAQERRRTVGQVRSILERFVIDPEEKYLRVYDDNDVLRVAIGDLGSDYGIVINDPSGATALSYNSGFIFNADTTFGDVTINGDLINTNPQWWINGAPGLSNYANLTGDGIDMTFLFDQAHPTTIGTFLFDMTTQYLEFDMARLGFFGTTAVVKQNVTGSTAGNAALQNLLTALAAYGLITDSTT